MKQLKKYSLWCLLGVVLVALTACQTMSAKKSLVMAYGVYNSQYSQYMTATGWAMNSDGVWEKVNSPELTDDQKDILRKKKVILVKLYPMIKIYDSMQAGTIPFDPSVESDLFALIDQLAAMTGGAQ